MSPNLDCLLYLILIKAILSGLSKYISHLSLSYSLNSEVNLIVNPPPEPDEPDEFEILYEVDGEGDVYFAFSNDLCPSQLIMEGQDSEAVIAIPDEGWIFVAWSDGVTDPFRIEYSVASDMELYAYFEK